MTPLNGSVERVAAGGVLLQVRFSCGRTADSGIGFGL
jgi:hypothetical protein